MGVCTPTQVFEHEVQINSKTVLSAVEMEYSPMSNSGKSSTSPRWAGGGPSCSAAEPASLSGGSNVGARRCHEQACKSMANGWWLAVAACRVVAGTVVAG